jgi:hypothetical protein
VSVQPKCVDGVSPFHDDVTELSLDPAYALSLCLGQTQGEHLKLEQDALQTLQQCVVQFPRNSLALSTPLVFQRTVAALRISQPQLFQVEQRDEQYRAAPKPPRPAGGYR